MTLKFSLPYRQVPRSSVGRASDRTMLRSVVRVQSLARGTCHFCLFFHFSHHIFLLAGNMSFMSLLFDTYNKYNRIYLFFLLTMSNWGDALAHKILKSTHVLLNWNSKFKWTEFPLTNWINSKPLQRRLFSSYQIAHMFLGLIFAVRSTPKTWL